MKFQHQWWQEKWDVCWHNVACKYLNCLHQTQPLWRLLPQLQWHHQCGKSWHHLGWLLKQFPISLTLSRRIIRENCWLQKPHPQSDFYQWFTIYWSQDKLFVMFHGKFGCRRNSTKRWQKLRLTNRCDPKLRSSTSCWMRRRRSQWKAWSCQQSGFWRLNKSSAMPLLFVEQLTCTSSKNLMIAFFNWLWRNIRRKACYDPSIFRNCWRQTSFCGMRSQPWQHRSGRLTRLCMNWRPLEPTCMGFSNRGLEPGNLLLHNQIHLWRLKCKNLPRPLRL